MNQSERMKAMITIVNRGDGLALSTLYAQNGVTLHFQIAASGTAGNELLSMLGLTHRDKDLLIGIGAESAVESLLVRLDKDYRGILRIRGLAFSIPMTAVTSLIADVYSIPASENEKGGVVMHPEKEHNLILVGVNQGYTDAVMHTACQAGATGGSVIRGRLVGAEPFEQHHGITLQGEREIILIACTKETRNAIMDAINAEHGISTKKQAFICSLPIDRMVRLA